MGYDFSTGKLTPQQKHIIAGRKKNEELIKKEHEKLEAEKHKSDKTLARKIVEQISDGNKNLNEDYFQVDVTIFRKTCELLQNKGLINGIDFSYYALDFGDAQVTEIGKKWLSEGEN
ncbi:hypothetical protein [Sporolactobacillus terrae]|uniref:hypothetical protein n=1 Tax=Sporolactobacillus terrae TaxID=269673 RepID=UPI00111AE8AC|nr:hypothetical protein [Sporolactobacillus terrae]